MYSPVQWQRIGLMLVDAALVTVALYLGYALRFNFRVSTLDHNQFLAAAPVFVAVRILLFFVFGLYRGMIRYAGTRELLAIGGAALLGTLAVIIGNLVLVPLIPAVAWLPQHDGFVQRVPLPVVIIECAMTILLTGAGRFSRRILVTELFRRAPGEGALRVLIVGAGDAGEAVARQMRQAQVADRVPAAFADDNRSKVGQRIHGIPVAGAIGELPRIIERYDIDEVLVAIPKVPPARLREIVSLCENARVSFKILPTMADVLAGRLSISQIRPVEIEDLLGRDEVRLELSDERNYVRGRRVLVTGAGGSIGSELVRQLSPLGPEAIILLGKGENSIYEMVTALPREGAAPRIVPVIGDIRDASKVEAVFTEHQPQIVFHAAAHKHVPLMEAHPDEAVKNNILGTRTVARAADRFGAERFILISSDKAVRPTNVMGATKRVAEMLVFCLGRTSKTQFVAVRFGNVLGSRGSVIPLFRRQIAAGGPVTVTHADVVRFFMTIPEAVSLVIEAGANKEQGRLYLLDMGQPVRIADLAHNLIRLSGFEPGRDIRIEFTGLRPGEKLKEELLTDAEGVRATDRGKIFTVEPEDVDCAHLEREIERLDELAERCDGDGIRALLRRLVADYHDEQVPPSA